MLILGNFEKGKWLFGRFSWVAPKESWDCGLTVFSVICLYQLARRGSWVDSWEQRQAAQLVDSTGKC